MFYAPKIRKVFLQSNRVVPLSAYNYILQKRDLYLVEIEYCMVWRDNSFNLKQKVVGTCSSHLLIRYFYSHGLSLRRYDHVNEPLTDQCLPNLSSWNLDSMYTLVKERK